jgi:hypothetical protein
MTRNDDKQGSEDDNGCLNKARLANAGLPTFLLDEIKISLAVKGINNAAFVILLNRSAIPIMCLHKKKI